MFTKEGGWPSYTMVEVARHCRKDDAWIVVGDRVRARESSSEHHRGSHQSRSLVPAQVYDMTAHVLNHEGWTASGKISTLLAILGAMGQDCTDDFEEVHSTTAWAILAAFQIGVLDKPNTGERRAQIRSWEELQRAGLV